MIVPVLQRGRWRPAEAGWSDQLPKARRGDEPQALVTPRSLLSAGHRRRKAGSEPKHFRASAERVYLGLSKYDLGVFKEPFWVDKETVFELNLTALALRVFTGVCSSNGLHGGPRAVRSGRWS